MEIQILQKIFTITIDQPVDQIGGSCWKNKWDFIWKSVF